MRLASSKNPKMVGRVLEIESNTMKVHWNLGGSELNHEKTDLRRLEPYEEVIKLHQEGKE